jgi:Rhodopirellula transposase DDE domain
MELHPKGQPEPVRVHNFVIPELGKAVPYGVYDIADNVGWVNLGISHDTAVFSVESIRRRWCELGTVRYPTATRLLITADCGVSNGVRLRLWLRELQVLARRTQHIDHRLPSATRHQAPGTSKWNRIQHPQPSPHSR